MSFADLPNARIWYEIDGPDSAPVLALSHSLGTDLSLWNAVVPYFTPAFRVLRYDTRGHGRTVSDLQSITIQALADDVVGLLDHVGAADAFFCGVSLGGLTGMMLGLTHRARVPRAVLSNTAARIGTLDSWNQRISSVRAGGMQSIANNVLERWFTPEYRSTNAPLLDKIRMTLLNTDPNGYSQCCLALRDTDLREQVSGIDIPCMIMTGSEDPVTTVAEAQFLVDHVPNAIYSLIPGAHLCCVESAEAFARAVITFLQNERR
jgi:3-oxoadipate enol-lactonase